MARWLIFCSFIICLTMTLLGLVLDISYQIYFQPIITDLQQKQDHNRDSYLEEKTYFAKHSFFAKKDDVGKDFADFLRSRTTGQKNFVLIRRDLQSKVLSLGEDWLEKKHLILPSSMVEDVFRRAHNYSKWSVDKTLALNENLAPTEFIVASQIYLANTVHARPDDIIEALKRVRHMSFLLLTSENFNFKLAGLSLLSKERDLIAYTATKKINIEKGWTIVTQNELNRYRRFLYKTYEYLDFLTSPKNLKRLFISDSLPIGFCAVYIKKIPLLISQEPLLSPTFPFEPSFTETLSVFNKIKQRAEDQCESVSKSPPANKSFLSYIPYYRRIKATSQMIQHRTLSEDN